MSISVSASNPTTSLRSWVRAHGPSSTRCSTSGHALPWHVPVVSNAGKVIKKSTMEETPKLRELVATEITVLQRCLNDNVIGYVDSFSNSKNVYIMMEYCNGGDMEKYLEKKGGRLG